MCLVLTFIRYIIVFVLFDSAEREKREIKYLYLIKIYVSYFNLLWYNTCFYLIIIE